MHNTPGLATVGSKPELGSAQDWESAPGWESVDSLVPVWYRKRALPAREMAEAQPGQREVLAQLAPAKVPVTSEEPLLEPAWPLEQPTREWYPVRLGWAELPVPVPPEKAKPEQTCPPV